jgi:hypothetical protein
MAKVVFVKVGTKDGLPIFSPLDADDVKAIGNREMIGFEMVGMKSLRTIAQNKSIRLYCRFLSIALNDAGYDMIATLKALGNRVFIPWSPEGILERLWRPVQKFTYGTDSTTKLDRDQVSIVYEALNVETSDKLEIGVPFPDRFMKLYEEEAKRER